MLLNSWTFKEVNQNVVMCELRLFPLRGNQTPKLWDSFVHNSVYQERDLHGT